MYVKYEMQAFPIIFFSNYSKYALIWFVYSCNFNFVLLSALFFYNYLDFIQVSYNNFLFRSNRLSDDGTSQFNEVTKYLLFGIFTCFFTWSESGLSQPLLLVLHVQLNVCLKPLL